MPKCHLSACAEKDTLFSFDSSGAAAIVGDGFSEEARGRRRPADRPSKTDPGAVPRAERDVSCRRGERPVKISQKKKKKQTREHRTIVGNFRTAGPSPRPSRCDSFASKRVMDSVRSESNVTAFAVMSICLI